MKIISFSCINKRRPGQTVHSPQDLGPEKADCAPTMSYFQLLSKLRRDRSLLPTDERNGKSCLFRSELLSWRQWDRATGRNAVRISGLWLCPILPLLFSEGKFGKSQLSGVPGLPQDMPAGQGCEGRGKAQQLALEAAPLEWNVPEKFLTADLFLAAAR